MSKVFSAYVEVMPRLATGSTSQLKAEVSKLGSSLGDEMGDKGGKGLSDGLVDGVRKARAKIDPTLAFQAKLESAQFKADVARETQSRELEIKARLDAASASVSIATLIRDREALIKAEADVARAKAELAELARDRKVEVEVDVDASKAASQLAATMSKAGAEGGTKAAQSMASGLSSVSSVAGPGLVAGAAGLGVTFGGALAGAILAAPGLLAVGGTIAGTIGLALNGVVDAISEVFNGNQAATKAATQLASAQSSLAGASQAVEQAEASLDSVRRQASQAGIQAARNLADAEKAYQTTVVDGSERVKEAKKAVTDAITSANDSNIASAKRVEDAERDLKDVQKEAIQAQQDLTQARKEAAQQLDDLNDSVRDNSLDIRQATLDQAEAQTEYNKILADPKATQAQKDAAEIAYQRISNRLSDLQERQTELQESQTEAATKGVEGSDLVTSAKEREADANQAVKDATDAVTAAQKEQTRTATEGAAAVATAQAGVVKAQREAADATATAALRIKDAEAAKAEAAISGAESIRSAQAGVESANRGVTSSLAAVKTANDAVSDTPLNKLSAAAKSFVSGLAAIAPQLIGIQQGVQEAFFEPLKDVGTRLKESGLLDVLKEGLTGVGTTLGTFVSGIFDQINKPENQAIFKKLFEGTSGFLEKIGPGIQTFFQTMLNLVGALAPHLPAIGAALGTMFSAIGGALDQIIASGAFDKLVSQFVAFMTGFSPVIATAIVSLFEAMANPATMSAMMTVLETATKLLPAFAGLIPPLAEFISFMVKVFQVEATVVIAAVTVVLGALSDYIRTVVGPAWTWVYEKAIKPALSGAQDVISAWWTWVKPVFDTLKTALDEVGDVFTWLYEEAVEPAFDSIETVIDEWWVWVQPIFDSLKVVLDEVGDVFTWLYDEAVKPAFDNIETLIGEWWTGAQTIFSDVKSGLVTVGDTFVALYDDYVSPAWDSIKAVFKSLGSFIKENVVESFETGVGLIGTAWDKVKALAAKPVKFVVSVLNDGIIPVWNKLASLVGGTQLKGEMPDILKGYAVGGAVRGPGTGTSDSIVARLSNGEHVLDAQDVQNMGGHAGVYKMRAAAAKGAMPGFAEGGAVDEIIAVMKKSGLSYSVNSTTRSGDPGYHGSSQAVDFGAGGHGSKYDAIRNNIADYWMRYSSSLLELIHRSDDGSKDWAVKNGSKVSGSYYGNGTMNEHRNHVHVAGTVAAMNAILGGSIEAGAGGSSSGGDSDGNWLIEQLRAAVGGLASKIPGSGYIPDAGRKTLTKGVDNMAKWAQEKVDALSDVIGFVTGGGNDGDADASGTFQNYAIQQFKNYGWDDNQFSALNKLWNKESGWNPRAENPSSGAYGIPQALPGSKMASAGSDWRTSGYTQVRWGLGYIKDRYGNPNAAWNHSVNTDWYDHGGDLMPGTSLVHNGTGKVESVVTEQWKKELLTAIGGLAGGGGAGVTIENITVTDRTDVDMLVNQLEWRLSGI